MNTILKFVLKIVSPLFWFTFLMSISLFMFHRRVVNEPGVKENPDLKTAAIICFLLGFLGTLLTKYLFISKKEKGLKTIWIANAIATFFYLPVFLLSLLMMA